MLLFLGSVSCSDPRVEKTEHLKNFEAQWVYVYIH